MNAPNSPGGIYVNGSNNTVNDTALILRFLDIIAQQRADIARLIEDNQRLAARLSGSGAPNE